jgi:hypothetical protein
LEASNGSRSKSKVAGENKMSAIESLFHDVIQKTDEMLELSSDENFAEIIENILEKREIVMNQLFEQLMLIPDTQRYQDLYVLWQTKELELKSIVNNSIDELSRKIKGQQDQKTSIQYDSYLRQMPYGAFLDKKR